MDRRLVPEAAPEGADERRRASSSPGRPTRFAPGSVTAFPAGKFYLVRLADGGFLALHRQCTHLGCSVPWDEASGRFACPCHASVFDLRGDVLAPPAPRPLDLFAVRIENGIVKVDTRRRSGARRFDAVAGHERLTR